MARFFIVFTILFVTIIGFVNDLYFAAPPSRVPETGTALLDEARRYPAPDFAFTGLDGMGRRLSDFKGRPVLLHFWASWCAPCIEEFPDLVDYVLRQKGALVLIALSSDRDAASMRHFLDKLPAAAQEGLRQDFIQAAHDKNYAVTYGIYRTTQYPETILIDPQQRMAGKIADAADWRAMDGLAAELGRTGR